MQFESWSAFWAMGGYSFFVWLAFGVTFVAMFLLVVQSLFEGRVLQSQVKRSYARKARIKAVMEASQ